MNDRKLTFDEERTLMHQRDAAEASERLSRKQIQLTELQMRVYEKLEKYLDMKLEEKK